MRKTIKKYNVEVELDQYGKVVCAFPLTGEYKRLTPYRLNKWGQLVNCAGAYNLKYFRDLLRSGKAILR